MALRDSYNDNNDIYVNNVNHLHISIRIILFELFSISRSDGSRCLSRDIFERSHDFLRYVSLYRNIFAIYLECFYRTWRECYEKSSVLFIKNIYLSCKSRNNLQSTE